VLAHQDQRDFRREATKSNAFGINDAPLAAFDLINRSENRGLATHENSIGPRLASRKRAVKLIQALKQGIARGLPGRTDKVGSANAAALQI